MNYSLKFIGLCGSLRKNSRNAGLLRCAERNLPDGVSMAIADIGGLPFYNEDLAKPQAVLDFIQLVDSADALVLACPEYNYSMAPALKNALDWVSREPGNLHLDGKPVAIVGAGGGMGSSRAQYHLRQTCVCLNMLPVSKPEFFANAFSTSFDEHGDLTDERLVGSMKLLMLSLRNWTLRLKLKLEP